MADDLANSAPNAIDVHSLLLFTLREQVNILNKCLDLLFI